MMKLRSKGKALRTLLYCAVLALGLGYTSTAHAKTNDLSNAIKQKLITAEIKGFGRAQGLSILVKVTNTSDSELQLAITPGTVLIPDDNRYARMVTRFVAGYLSGQDFVKTTDAYLEGRQTTTFVVAAYSLDFNKLVPSKQTRFTLGPVDKGASALFDMAATERLTSSTIQAAIWMKLGNVSGDQVVKRIPLSDAELGTATRISLAETPAEQPAAPPAVVSSEAAITPTSPPPDQAAQPDSSSAKLPEAFEPVDVEPMTTADTTAPMAYILRESTPVLVKPVEKLVSGKIRTGTSINLVVARDVLGPDKQLLIEAGAPASGTIIKSSRKSSFGKAGNLEIEIVSALAVDGTTVPLHGFEIKRGSSKGGTAIGVCILCGLIGAYFVRGGDATIDQNVEMAGFVTQDTPVHTTLTRTGDNKGMPAEIFEVSFPNGTKVTRGDTIPVLVTPKQLDKAIQVRILIDGAQHFSREKDFGLIELGTRKLTAGKHSLVVEVTFANDVVIKEPTEIEVVEPASK